MAQIETISPYQQELAEKYASLYGAVYGSNEGLSITGKKNHRVTVAFPENYGGGGEPFTETYSYTNFEAEVTGLEAQLQEMGSKPFDPITGQDGEELMSSEAIEATGESEFSEEELELLNEAFGEPEVQAEAATDGADNEAGQAEDTVPEAVPAPAKSPRKPKAEEVTRPGKTTKRSTAIPRLLADMLKHSDAGSRGKLAVGQDLVTLERYATEEGLNQREAVAEAKSFFEAKGRRFPTEADRSRMRTAARSWLETPGYDLDTEFASPLYQENGAPRTTVPDGDTLVPMPLGSLDVNTLYSLRELVKPGDDEHNASVIALANTFSYKTITKIAKHLNVQNFEPQFREWLKLGELAEDAAITWAKAKQETKEPEFKSIGGLPAGLVNRFKGPTLDEMTELAIEAGVFEPFDAEKDGEKDNHKVNNTFGMEILTSMWDLLPARTKLLVIKNAHGTISEDEHLELTGREVETVVEGIPF